MDVSSSKVPKYSKFKGETFLDEELQNKLREIVKCGVCFEVPAGKDLKVLTCMQGHHFCGPCRKKQRNCGICRGQFYQGRNFVVEEMITQLGPSLGLVESKIPPPDVEPPNLIAGTYACLHNCKSYFKAGRMIKHIRKCHKQHLLDNVRSNPYIDRFDMIFDVSYSPKNLNAYSVQISDMGLFTILINITDNCLLGSVHSLADNNEISLFKYKLTVEIEKTDCTHEFSISNCDLQKYIYEIDALRTSGRCLSVETTKLSEFINIGDKFHVTFSIWKKKENEKNKSDLTVFFPEVPFVIPSDRKTRRNRNRNVRKSKLKMKLNSMKNPDNGIVYDIKTYF